MKNVFYSILFFSICIVGLDSCGSSTPTPACSTLWASELQNEITAITNAATAHATNPTPATCSALKSAYQSYIDALKPYGSCAALTGQDRTDFNNTLENAEDDVANIC